MSHVPRRESFRMGLEVLADMPSAHIGEGAPHRHRPVVQPAIPAVVVTMQRRLPQGRRLLHLLKLPRSRVERRQHRHAGSRLREGVGSAPNLPHQLVGDLYGLDAVIPQGVGPTREGWFASIKSLLGTSKTQRRCAKSPSGSPSCAAQ